MALPALVGAARSRPRREKKAIPNDPDLARTMSTPWTASCRYRVTIPLSTAPWLFALLTIVLCGVFLHPARGQGSKPLPTPRDVWRDFDPQSGPLEEEVLARRSEGGVAYKDVYFSAHVHGEKVRVYGTYAAPRPPGSYPAVLHLHGGGQTVGLHWLETWTSRGYAVLSIDSHGQWPNRKRYTLYPASLKHGNHREAGPLLRATEPSPRAGSWYIWAALNRRALTYLAAQKEVDEKRMGIFGISMGGTTVWHVAIDQRVRAACAVYGVGWNEHALFDERFNEDRRRPQPSVRQKVWNSAMAPQACPPYIRCPLLFLSASNDHHGNLDYVFDTMSRMRDGVPWRVAITPHFRHHVGKAESENLLLWMDTWLKDGSAWPRTPATALTIGALGDPVLQLEVDDTQPIARIRVYYNIGQTDNKSRYWREVEPVGAGKKWSARLSITDVGQSLVAFANVHYESGVCLTAPLVAGVPARLGAARANDRPSLRIYDGGMGVRGWTTESPGTDPNPPVPVPLLWKRGPGGKAGIAPQNRYRRLMTYKIGDPRWRGPDGARLRFKAYSRLPQRIALRVADRVVSHRAREYSADGSLAGAEDWQTVTLSTDRFEPTSGDAPLASWEDLVVLWIVPARGPAFEHPGLILTDLEWVPHDEGDGKSGSGDGS